MESFYSTQKASITVNNQDYTIHRLSQAGLPQGSPPSPILLLFYNTNLVQFVMTSQKGAIAFIDNFNVWVTGDTASANTTAIREQIIPRAVAWEQASGAAFEASKTALIHFTRHPSKDNHQPVQFKEIGVHPSTAVKLLGVIFDQQLRFADHAGRAAKRGLQVGLVLNRLRGLRSNTVRQLFHTMVTPFVDYASPIRSLLAAEKVLRLLQPIQRLAAKSITGLFRTTVVEIAEVEAAILPAKIRWKRQRLNF